MHHRHQNLQYYCTAGHSSHCQPHRIQGSGKCNISHKPLQYMKVNCSPAAIISKHGKGTKKVKEGPCCFLHSSVPASIHITLSLCLCPYHCFPVEKCCWCKLMATLVVVLCIMEQVLDVGCHTSWTGHCCFPLTDNEGYTGLIYRTPIQDPYRTGTGRAKHKAIN